MPQSRDSSNMTALSAVKLETTFPTPRLKSLSSSLSRCFPLRRPFQSKQRSPRHRGEQPLGYNPVGYLSRCTAR